MTERSKSVAPLPLSRLPGFRDRGINAGDAFPGAERLAERLITLPTHAKLSSSDPDRLERGLERPLEDRAAVEAIPASNILMHKADHGDS